MTEWQKVQGDIMPDEFDTTSSAVYVYQRRNIEQTENKWQYEERKMSHEEYMMIRPDIQQEQIDQTRADIDYIMAMEDLE